MDVENVLCMFDPNSPQYIIKIFSACFSRMLSFYFPFISYGFFACAYQKLCVCLCVCSKFSNAAAAARTASDRNIQYSLFVPICKPDNYVYLNQRSAYVY